MTCRIYITFAVQKYFFYCAILLSETKLLTYLQMRFGLGEFPALGDMEQMFQVKGITWTKLSVITK